MSHRRALIGATSAAAAALLIAALSYSQAIATSPSKASPPRPKPMISKVIADVTQDAWVYTPVSSLPTKVQSLIPAATTVAKGQPLAGGTFSQPRAYVSTGSPVQYLFVWNVSTAATQTGSGILPPSTVSMLYDGTLTQQGIESNILLTPSVGTSSFKDASGTPFKYLYMRADGTQFLNTDQPEFLNDVPGASSTDPTCLAYSVYQYAVDLGHAAIDFGQLDEPGVDELNVFDSGISYSTDDDGSTECPSGE